MWWPFNSSKEKQRTEINYEIDRIERDFEREIQLAVDFETLSSKKQKIILKIEPLWDKNWKVATNFLKDKVHRLVQKQIIFMKNLKESVEDEAKFLTLLFRSSAQGFAQSVNNPQSEIGGISA